MNVDVHTKQQENAMFSTFIMAEEIGLSLVSLK
jgi:hypothetical protein